MGPNGGAISMKRNTRGSARALTGLAVSATLALAGAATWSQPAISLPPSGDCAVPFPEADLVTGQPVNGLTVATGTTPDGFTGEVMGVLKDGIAPGVDMIMMRLTSSEIDRVGGIWAGMSGSPVYAEDGRLIGAVSYGLALGPSTVAGVTPYEQMDDYLAAPPLMKVKVGDRTAQKIAAGSEVSKAMASGGFEQLRMPLGVSGVGAKRLSQAKGRTWLSKNTYAAGASAAPGVGPGVESIVAGGNLGAGFSWGDITIGGVGTVTSVCGDSVVGFGHPLGFLGHTTAALMPADAIYIQEDPTLNPFKVANLSAPVGTITDDHLTGITGNLDGEPPSMKVTSTVGFESRSRTGSSNVSVEDAAAEVTFYEVFANQDRVVDAIMPGSELETWTIKGHTTAGRSFSLHLTDRYASSYDITGAAPWDIADQVYALGSLPGVTLDDVSIDASVTDDPSMYSLGDVQQYRNGHWVKASGSNPIQAKPGTQARLRVRLTSLAGDTWREVKVSVPKGTGGTQARLTLVGGYNLWGGSTPRNLDGALAHYRAQVRNDEIQVSLSIDKGPRGIEKTSVTGPSTKVVRGVKRVAVRIG